MPIEFTDIVVFSAGGIVTYFGRQFFEQKLAVTRNYQIIRSTEFNKAAAAFRAEFVVSQMMLHQNINTPNIVSNSEILTKDIFIAQEKAKIMFEPFIDKPKLSSFNEAWENYRYHEPKHGNTGNPEYKKTLSESYLCHLEHLLSYAQPDIST